MRKITVFFFDSALLRKFLKKNKRRKNAFKLLFS